MAPSDPTIAVGVLDEPPAEIRYRRAIRPIAALGELYRARQLIFTLAERDIRASIGEDAPPGGWPARS